LCGAQCPTCGPQECVSTAVGYVEPSRYVHSDEPDCQGVVPAEIRLAVHAVAAYYSSGATLANPEAVEEAIENARSRVRSALAHWRREHSGVSSMGSPDSTSRAVG
jgi:hypothetical protein